MNYSVLPLVEKFLFCSFGLFFVEAVRGSLESPLPSVIHIAAKPRALQVFSVLPGAGSAEPGHSVHRNV